MAKRRTAQRHIVAAVALAALDVELALLGALRRRRVRVAALTEAEVLLAEPVGLLRQRDGRVGRDVGRVRHLLQLHAGPSSATVGMQRRS